MGRTFPIDALAISNARKIVACGTHENHIMLFIGNITRRVNYISSNRMDISSLAFSGDGTLLASCAGEYNYHIHIWSVDTGNCLLSWKSDRAIKLNFSPDNRFLISCCFDSNVFPKDSIRLYKLSDKSCLCTLLINSPLMIRRTVQYNQSSGDVLLSEANKIFLFKNKVTNFAHLTLEQARFIYLRYKLDKEMQKIIKNEPQ